MLIQTLQRKGYALAKIVNIIAINGSIREGETDRMLDDMSSQCHQVRACQYVRTLRQITTIGEWRTVRVAVTKIQLADEWHVPLFFRDQTLPPLVIRLLNVIVKADGIIMASPTNWNGPSPAMTNLLAYLENCEKAEGWPLKDMPVGFGACGDTDGCQTTIDRMAATMMHLRCKIVTDGMYYRNTTIQQLDLTGREQEWMNTDAPLVGTNVLEAALLNKILGIRP